MKNRVTEIYVCLRGINNAESFQLYLAHDLAISLRAAIAVGDFNISGSLTANFFLIACQL